jgi:hypothetical protein
MPMRKDSERQRRAALKTPNLDKEKKNRTKRKKEKIKDYAFGF